MIQEWQTLELLSEFGLQMKKIGKGRHFGCLVIQPTIMSKILEAQQGCDELKEWFEKMAAKEPETWSIGSDGGLRCKNRLSVLKDKEFRKDILEGAHRSKLTIHPGETKMYNDLTRSLWWQGMKKDMANSVSRCVTCQQV